MFKNSLVVWVYSKDHSEARVFAEEYPDAWILPKREHLYELPEHWNGEKWERPTYMELQSSKKFDVFEVYKDVTWYNSHEDFMEDDRIPGRHTSIEEYDPPKKYRVVYKFRTIHILPVKQTLQYEIDREIRSLVKTIGMNLGLSIDTTKPKKNAQDLLDLLSQIESHTRYMPGGPGAKEAKEEFDKMKSYQKMKKK